MTPDEQRLALMTGSCPECGHGILAHRGGYCRADISTKNNQHMGVMCWCQAVQPPNSQGQQLELK